jgi:uncharacterized protein YkwD
MNKKDLPPADVAEMDK